MAGHFAFCFFFNFLVEKKVKIDGSLVLLWVPEGPPACEKAVSSVTRSYFVNCLYMHLSLWIGGLDVVSDSINS